MKLVLVSLLPRRLLSGAVGCFARTSWPAPLTRWLILLFCRFYSIDLSECERPVESYPTLDAFFVRKIKPDRRPVGEGFVSPVDALLSNGAAVGNLRAVQAKGLWYDLSDLLGGIERARSFSRGSVLTLYLAPRNYHRFHAPIDLQLLDVEHFPGTLYPVNHLTVGVLPRLFCRNERIVLFCQSELGYFAMVLVGALNVGSIRLTGTNVRTNGNPLWGASMSDRLRGELSLPRRYLKGEDLGAFHLGSTIILVFEKDFAQQFSALEGQHIRFGQSLLP